MCVCVRTVAVCGLKTCKTCGVILGRQVAGSVSHFLEASQALPVSSPFRSHFSAWAESIVQRRSITDTSFRLPTMNGLPRSVAGERHKHGLGVFSGSPKSRLGKSRPIVIDGERVQMSRHMLDISGR